MIHLLGVHAFDEANVIDHLRGMGHQGTDRCARLTVLLKRLDRVEQDPLVGSRRHRAETLPFHVTRRNGFVVQLRQRRLLVEQLEMTRPAILKEVNDALGLGRDLLECF